MNSIFKYMLVAAMVPAFASCLDETMPTGASAGPDQIANADKSGLANAVVKYLNTTTNIYEHWDIGYPAMIMFHDQMAADNPVKEDSYNYFVDFGNCRFLDDRTTVFDMYNMYYQIILRANKLLEVCSDERTEDAPHIATGCVFRAMAYMDLMRNWEYRATGIPSLDGEAESTGIWGLTVPIVTEKTSEAKSFNNPRAPFYKMYRFILTDLNRAERAIPNIGSRPKNMASEGVVYGMKARFWLEVATRCRRFPQDLETIKAHDSEKYDAEDDLGESYGLDPLGITSATEAYRLAADYARRAIGMGYTPTTQSEWFNATTGFNTVANSWMLCIMMSKSDPMVASNTWKSWVGFNCLECNYGVANLSLGAYRMIDVNLFDKISPSDWRRNTWLAPEDVAASEDVFKQKYAGNTVLEYSEWAELPAYTAFKFHTAQGERNVSATANQVDIPLMRVEEMYLIEAEARGFSEGLAAGSQLLESFMNTYRMTDGSYRCPAGNLDALAEEVVVQKRIELWGEGQIIFDLMRLGIPVTRGYTGTNHVESYRFNSIAGYVPAWCNIFISRNESDQNQAVLPNPNPTPALLGGYLWSE